MIVSANSAVCSVHVMLPPYSTTFNHVSILKTENDSLMKFDKLSSTKFISLLIEHNSIDIKSYYCYKEENKLNVSKTNKTNCCWSALLVP